MAEPSIVVFTTLFPSSVQPGAGLFIRERMFRVGKTLPVTVVAPVPWFPLQGLIRLWRPHYRPMPPKREVQEGIEVLHPRFFSVPGLLRNQDGLFLALSCLPLMARLKRSGRCNIIDAHFAYPEGYAASLLGQWLRLPVTVTLRGTEVPHATLPGRRRRMIAGLQRATRIFSVSDSLRRHAVGLGIEASKIRVIGNGVDLDKFHPVDRQAARERLDIPPQAKVLISVGGLVERKGFHRVLDCLPALLREFPDLLYLIVGGKSAEGDWGDKLRTQAARLGIADRVRFLGTIAPAELKWALSAADVFALATRNEGWANVFLEAMACGLPVVTTDVGGNREVVVDDTLGSIVPFGKPEALLDALRHALARQWDRQSILAYAQDNSWDKRIANLLDEFSRIAARHAGQPCKAAA